MDKPTKNNISFRNIPEPILIVLAVSFMAILVFIFFRCKAGLGGAIIAILIALLLFVWLIEVKHKYHINRITYHIKHDINRHERKILHYSLVFMVALIVGYECLCIVGAYYPLLPLYLERKEYYAIIISFSSLFVALLLTLKLDVKKIESGGDFLHRLELHAKELQRKSIHEKPEERLELHIYTPNINVGVANITQKSENKSIIRKIIEECDKVQFVFHCCNYTKELIDNKSIYAINNYQALEKHAQQKKKNGKLKYPMLVYLLDYFKNTGAEANKLIEKCMADLNEIINKPNVQVSYYKSAEELVGYRSKYELVLGKYISLEGTGNTRSGKVEFYGEVVTVSEFISFVEQMEKK